jgi:hypothetical protein
LKQTTLARSNSKQHPTSINQLPAIIMSCPACFRGAAHNHAEPKGTMETIHGMRTYVAGGSDPARSKSAIIYLPDAFSLKLVNNKLLADEYAAGTGCKVYIPDVVVSLYSLLLFTHSIAFRQYQRYPRSCDAAYCLHLLVISIQTTTKKTGKEERRTPKPDTATWHHPSPHHPHLCLCSPTHVFDHWLTQHH